MKTLLIVCMNILVTQLLFITYGGNSRKTEKFIQDQIYSQRMDMKTGGLASEFGTTDLIRNYGSLMVKEHQEMLLDLEELAIQKNVSIPFKLKEKQSRNLDNLREKKGRSFDRLFIKMMINDHTTDIHCLRIATLSKDEDVKLLAKKYLPILEDHLDEARDIRSGLMEAKR